MNLSEVKVRREAVIERELTIVAELAESKRAWFADKSGIDMLKRTTLEAELASLALERHGLTAIMSASKTAEKSYRANLSGAILIRLLNERGLADIVIEADRLAVDFGVERAQ